MSLFHNFTMWTTDFAAIIEQAPAEIRKTLNSQTEYCKFFETVRALSVASRFGLESTQSMVSAIEPLEKMSRDLRPVLRRLRQALTIMVESKTVSNEWVHLIENFWCAL